MVDEYLDKVEGVVEKDLLFFFIVGDFSFSLDLESDKDVEEYEEGILKFNSLGKKLLLIKIKLFFLIILFVIVGRLVFLESKEESYVDWDLLLKCYELNIYLVFFV